MTDRSTLLEPRLPRGFFVPANHANGRESNPPIFGH